MNGQVMRQQDSENVVKA